MFRKMIVLVFLLGSYTVMASSFTFQVVEKDFNLSPALVESVKISESNPALIRLTLSDEGIKQFNHFLADAYDKKLNIIFNGEIIQLGTMIKATEFPQSFLISTPNKKIATEVYNYLRGAPEKK